MYIDRFVGTGGRRVRGGSTRGSGGLQQSVSNDGPSLEELAKMGIKVNVLQGLIPNEDLADRQLLTLDQVSMKGEDLTGTNSTYIKTLCTTIFFRTDVCFVS